MLAPIFSQGYVYLGPEFVDSEDGASFFGKANWRKIARGFLRQLARE